MQEWFDLYSEGPEAKGDREFFAHESTYGLLYDLAQWVD